MKDRKDRTRISGHSVLNFFVAILIVLLGLAAPAQASAVSAAAPGPKRGPHIMPFRPRGSAIPSSLAPAGAHLTYYGGPVLSNMKSIDVSYGAGTYLSNNSAALQTFTAQLLGSGLLDWLQEYDTNLSGGTNQHIGRGTSNGAYTITPSSANNGASITDAQIQAELLAQINAGSLPAPDANTSYAIFFRLGQQICQGGSCSLVSGGFCAYHSTFNAPNNVVATYQVLPDLTGTTGCGGSNDFGNTTSVLSHELVETVTDPQVGFAGAIAPPLAWYDLNNGEISDICNAIQGTFMGTNNITYVAQLQFSNIANDCIMTRSIVNDFSISASPASLTLNTGTSGASTISTAVASGTAGTVSLAVSGAPSGVTATLNPGVVTAGGSSTLSVSVGASAGPGNYTLTISGTEGAFTHSTQVALTVPDTTKPSLSLPAAVSVNATDPSGASVSYTVTASDPDNTPAQLTITCSPASGSVFAIGTTTVNCSASDPAGNTATGSFTVTVKSASAQLQDLIDLVKSFNLSPNVQTSLLNKLKDVQQALGSGQVALAVSDLNDFISKVKSLSGKGLTNAQANHLIQAASQIIAVLGS